MVATKGQAIALAVISILTIGSGIAVIVLFKFTFDALQRSTNSTPLVAIFWPYGLPVLFTGVMGLVAAGFRNNVVVGLFMAAGIICLIIEGVLAVIAGLVLFLISPIDTGTCVLVNNSCLCGSTYSLGGVKIPPSILGGAPCDNNLLGLSRASCALIIVAWLLMLAGTIASCAACCCGKRDGGQAGAIIVGSPGYEMHNTGGAHPKHLQYSQPVYQQ